MDLVNVTNTTLFNEEIRFTTEPTYTSPNEKNEIAKEIFEKIDISSKKIEDRPNKGDYIWKTYVPKNIDKLITEDEEPALEQFSELEILINKIKLIEEQDQKNAREKSIPNGSPIENIGKIRKKTEIENDDKENIFNDFLPKHKKFELMAAESKVKQTLHKLEQELNDLKTNLENVKSLRDDVRNKVEKQMREASRRNY